MSDLAAISGQWWVCQTHPQLEKRLARRLIEHGVSYFLPMEQTWVRHSGKARQKMEVVFPTYLFFVGDIDTRIWVASARETFRTIHISQQERFIKQLNRFSQALAAGIVGERAFRGLRVGAPCVVIGGPFVGWEGTIVRDEGKDRFVIWLDAIGGGKEVEIDGYLLKRTDQRT